jgi:hypothetical protein
MGIFAMEEITAVKNIFDKFLIVQHFYFTS